MDAEPGGILHYKPGGSGLNQPAGKEYEERESMGKIRSLDASDVSTVAKIWLETNLEAHSFIPAGYWEENFESVKGMLPEAEVYVFEDEEKNGIQGFIGLNDRYVEGIFVRKEAQSRGIGKALLNFAKKKKGELTLNVYQKNRGAVKFYLREGFQIREESTDEMTGEAEYLMIWGSSAI